MQEKTYKELNDLENIRKLREVLKTLPAFLKTYFRSLETTKSTRTRLSYAYDLSIFFEFLRQNNPQFAKQEPSSMKIPADILDGLTKIDIEEYMSFLQEYQNKDGKNRSNKDSGILRKMAALRSMYHYYYINEDIKNNAPAQIVIPKKIGIAHV